MSVPTYIFELKLYPNIQDVAIIIKWVLVGKEVTPASLSSLQFNFKIRVTPIRVIADLKGSDSWSEKIS
jgi:hypothetical protein